MNRRTFIQRLVAGGAALGAGLSLTSLVSDAKGVIFPISPTREHVRHGLFSPEKADSFWPGPKWLTQLQRDRFFANGIDADRKDMFISNFKVGEQELGLTLHKDKVSMFHRGSSQLLVRDQAIECHRQEPFRVHVLHVGLGVTLPEASLGRELLVVPIHGKATVNARTLRQDHAMYFKRPHQVRFESKKEAMVLLISRT